MKKETGGKRRKERKASIALIVLLYKPGWNRSVLQALQNFSRSWRAQVSHDKVTIRQVLTEACLSALLSPESLKACTSEL